MSDISGHFDLLVIGAGSGGLSVAQRAATYGARVAIVEMDDVMGGTCVNRGCVPKKVMWYAAELEHAIHDAVDYGFAVTHKTHKPDWKALVNKRDNMISGIHGFYEGYLSDVTTLQGKAKMVEAHTVQVGEARYSADHIVLATGGRPRIPMDIPGAELGISSDGFFELDEQPNKVAVVGGGYIALELAGIFNALGTETHLLHQGHSVLRGFDQLLKDTLQQQMITDGVFINHQEKITRVERDANNRLTLHYKNGECLEGLEQVVWATGRVPNTDDIGLEAIGLDMAANGLINVNDYQETNLSGLYAIGDIINKRGVQLTPVAIAAGRRLADRLFGGLEGRKVDYSLIPTVMFTHPPIGTIGLSEEEAREEYGDAIKVYTNEFTPMYYAFTQRKVKTAMKLIVVGEDEKIVGCHAMGVGVDEMMQGFAVAIRMGATKRDFDDTIAIHPVSAEEMVTMK